MTESRTIQTLKNVFSGLFQKTLSLFLIFISRKYFIKYIGIEFLGINSLFSNILSLLSMADLGFGVAMAYSFYKPISENDETKITALICFYKKVYSIIAIVILLIGLLILPFLNFFINISQSIPNLKLYYIIFLLQTVVSYLFVYKGTLLNANQKSYVVNLIITSVNLIKTIAQIIAIIVLHNYIVFILMQLFANIIQNILISHKAEQLYPFIKNKELLDNDSIVLIKKNMSSIFLYKISSVFMNSIDSILISKLINTAVLGMYSNYMEIQNGLFAFLNIIFSSVTASVGNLVASESGEKKYDVFRAMQLISYYLSLFVIVCMFTTLQDFIAAWVGTEYLLDTKTLVFICLNFYFSICVMPLWSYREACGIYMKTKYIMSISAILNLVFSLVFFKYLGLAGIIAASTVSRCLTYFWYEPKILYKDIFSKPVRTYFIYFILNAVFAIIFCAALSITHSFIFKTISLQYFIVKNLVNFFVVTFFYYLLTFKTREFKMIKTKIVFRKRG